MPPKIVRRLKLTVRPIADDEDAAPPPVEQHAPAAPSAATGKGKGRKRKAKDDTPPPAPPTKVARTARDRTRDSPALPTSPMPRLLNLNSYKSTLLGESELEIISVHNRLRDIERALLRIELRERDAGNDDLGALRPIRKLMGVAKGSIQDLFGVEEEEEKVVIEEEVVRPAREPSVEHDERPRRTPSSGASEVPARFLPPPAPPPPPPPSPPPAARGRGKSARRPRGPPTVPPSTRSNPVPGGEDEDEEPAPAPAGRRLRTRN